MRLSIVFWRIMEIEDSVIYSRCRPSSCVLAVFAMFLAIIKFRLVPAVVLTLETSEVSAILVFTMKTTQSGPQVFSVDGALICRRLHFWRHFLVKHKILPNLVISNWLWWIMCVLLANQNFTFFLLKWPFSLQSLYCKSTLL